MKKLNLFAGLAALSVSLILGSAGVVQAAQALKQPEMVVSATKTEETLDQVSSTVFVVTDQEMEEKGAWSLPDALRDVPGLYVRSNGAFAGPTMVTMRGGHSSQVRVMMDGVRLADPISTSGGFNLSLMDVGAVDQLEVVQGPQSTLYGSDAMAGIINLITKRGRGKPSFWATGEGGSYSTMRGQLGTQGEVDGFNFFASASGITTDGISSAKDQPEKDSYNNHQFNARVGYEFKPGTELYGIGYYHKADVDYDSFWSGPADSDDNVKNTSWSGILGFRQEVSNWWDHKLTLSNGKTKREYSDESEYNSELTTAEWQHNLHYKELATLTLGLDWEQEKGDYVSPLYSDALGTQKSELWGGYLQAQISPIKGLNLLAGARNDHHDSYGDEATWRAGASYYFGKTGTKLRSTYGTGFKSPTLYQLYSKFGDKDLSPEKSKGWDAGIDQEFFKGRLKLSLTYFSLKTDDLILWDFGTYKYKNVDQAKSSGLEFSFKAMLTKWLGLDGSYTYTDSENDSTGKELVYVPRNKATLGFRLQPIKGLVARVYGLYVGKRYDDDDNLEEVDAYFTVNLAASYEINKYLKLTGRVVNLFDEDYEEIKDFGTMGLSAFVGLKLSY